MKFDQIDFHSEWKQSLRQMYAVLYYMKIGYTRIEATHKAKKHFIVKDKVIDYRTVESKLGRQFAGRVKTFDEWHKSGKLLYKLVKTKRLDSHDEKILREVLEEDIPYEELLEKVETDLDSMNEEEKELTEKERGVEGKHSEKIVRSYERNRKLRVKAIKIHGFKCIVCGFDFKEVYGKIGEHFIEVHHLKPVSTFKCEIEVDPELDMAVVCCNCHRMIHRDKNNILSIKELEDIVIANRK